MPCLRMSGSRCWRIFAALTDHSRSVRARTPAGVKRVGRRAGGLRGRRRLGERAGDGRGERQDEEEDTHSEMIGGEALQFQSQATTRGRDNATLSLEVQLHTRDMGTTDWQS